MTSHASRRQSSSSPLTLTARLLQSVGILLSISLTVAGGQMALAGMSSNQASTLLTYWERPGHAPSGDAWVTAQSAAQKAVHYYPVANGEYQERLARIWLWKDYSQPFAAETAQQSRAEALQGFRNAVTLRPDWPLAWVGLSNAKAYQMQFDSEFEQAIQQAASSAPHHLATQRSLAEIALLTWPYLSRSSRDLGSQAIQMTARRSHASLRQLEQIAVANQNLQPLCQALASIKPEPRLTQAHQRLCGKQP